MKHLNIYYRLIIVYILFFLLNNSVLFAIEFVRINTKDSIKQSSLVWEEMVLKKIIDSVTTQNINITNFDLPIEFIVNENGKIIIDDIYYQNQWLTFKELMEYKNKSLQEDSLLLKIGQIALSIIQHSDDWNLNTQSQLLYNQDYEYLFYAKDGILYFKNTGFSNKCGFPKK